ncbi:MAG: elongation factor P maturation arginine rhamnosyltransferase EarP [Treponema sp.]|nr:elongation factor P maturation arginine rhamnosyltransferase EarP [Treponema sp.]
MGYKYFMKKILLLCRVVDNYGDIGFVYRLSRSLSELYPEDYELTLAVSNLDSFSKLCPSVSPDKSIQKCCGWNILDWNASEKASGFISKNFPDVILECFQCGRPEWLDELLFDSENRKCLIVNVEYLTAEEWADDFHLLKSGTRSSSVKKINFMPGFTDKTGGLVLDSSFTENLSSASAALNKIEGLIPQESFSAIKTSSDFNVLVFNYKRDFSVLAAALEKFSAVIKKNVRIFAAPGLSFDSVVEAAAGLSHVKIQKLPYMCQTSWDALLCLMDFNFIRGEDSFSRAALCGKPFVWDIYPQEGQFHLVKLEAFLLRLKPYFSDGQLFKRFRRFVLGYNLKLHDEICSEALDAVTPEEYKCLEDKDFAVNELLYLFDEYSALKDAFSEFAGAAVSNGNLTVHLNEVLKNYF